ncbi:MAG: fibronectin type III domain-containing protein [Sinobacteraceae bacterium]|nr:fibronectin type III domain-containing protein [Nevskiaceae bacterium]
MSPRVGTIDRGPSGASKTSTTTTSSGSTSVASNGTGKGTTQPVIPPVNGTDGSATLDWTPPTQNSDGTSLTNLAGYTVYYGTSPSNLNQSVKLTNPGLTAYTVSNLPPGTWYFAVASYSSDGAESTPSGVVSTTI